MNVSIKAKPINVLLNSVSDSSGFLDTAILKPANNTPVPKAPNLFAAAKFWIEWLTETDNELGLRPPNQGSEKETE